MIVQLRAVSGVHRFSICRSSVRHFPERSWTVVAFPCFTVIKSFTSWYALLLLFFLRFSSISLHCSPIQFTFAFFMHLLMLLFTFLYFSDSSGSNRFFLSSLILSQRSRISAMSQVVVVFCLFVCLFSADDVCQQATIPYWIGRRPGRQGPRLPPYTRTEVSSMLLVHHQRFVEETTSP